MKQFTSKTQKTGELGEKICLQYLKDTDFDIIDINYTQACGEIDIVARKDKAIHFIEVKSSKMQSNVSYETYNPAENLTPSKLQKIHLTIQHYLSSQNVSYETKWFIDLYCVFIDTRNHQHKIRVLENIIS